MRKKTKVDHTNKCPAPNKDDIICPLVLEISGNRVAYSYGVEWAGQTAIEIDGINCKGVWRSSVRTGPSKTAFETALKVKYEQFQIDWKDKSWYFTHEEGMKAAAEYADLAMRGQVKANKKVWDRQFAETTGVTFEELVKSNPKTYKKGGTTPSIGKLVEKHELPPTLDTLEGPKDEELLAIVESEHPQRVSEQHLVVKVGGKDRHLYKTYVEELEKLYYLEPGEHTINGVYVLVEADDHEETQALYGGTETRIS